MNRFFLTISFLISYFTIFQLSAENNNNYKQIYNTEIVETIQANGLVKLNETRVTNYLHTNGCLKAKNSQIEEMQINGRANLDHCLIKQKSMICGALIAKNSQFTDVLSVSSEKVLFDSCALTSLYILDNKQYFDSQVVELKGNTQISGPIIFHSGNGEVIAGPDCKIMGDIIGGKIRK